MTIQTIKKTVSSRPVVTAALTVLALLYCLAFVPSIRYWYGEAARSSRVAARKKGILAARKEHNEARQQRLQQTGDPDWWEKKLRAEGYVPEGYVPLIIRISSSSDEPGVGISQP